MKIIKIIILIICSILSLYILKLILTSSPTNSDTQQDDRFIKIYRNDSLIIYYDKETNVEYVVRDNGHGGTSMTLLVNAEGKPLLYEKGDK